MADLNTLMFQDSSSRTIVLSQCLYQFSLFCFYLLIYFFFSDVENMNDSLLSSLAIANSPVKIPVLSVEPSPLPDHEEKVRK